jgi:hypothetical protein
MNVNRLASVWTEWASAASQLLAALNLEEQALVARDTARVEELLPLIDERRLTLEAIDARAREASVELSTKLGCVPSLSCLCQRLGPAASGPLLTLAQRVSALGNDIRAAMIKNHALIENELAYVAATLAVIGQALREPVTPYGRGTAGALALDRTV